MLPPPIVVALDGASTSEWTSYLTPAATWRKEDLPVSIAFATTDAEASALGGGDLRALLDVASRAWGLPACSAARFLAVATRTRDGTEAENGRNDIIVHLVDWPPPLASGAAGHTVIYTLGDRIIEADIHLNARDFTFAIGAVPGRIDLQAILTHELGHVLGIGHSEEPRATMAEGLPFGIAARSLERDDRDAACALYPAATPNDGGCATTPCPAGFRCVGFTCERDGELGVDGAQCAAATEVRRCDGAGDSARCIATSLGERCARPCTTDRDCGVGLRCAALATVDFVCVPTDATVNAMTDAGVPSDAAPSDAASPQPPSAAEGCACTFRRSRGDAWWLIALGIFIAGRRRTSRR